MGWPAGWSRADQIRWVEMRLMERRAIEEKGVQGYDLDAAGIPDRVSLEIWLAKERDDLSWQQIAQKYKPALYKRSKAAAMSSVRRAHEAVDNSPNPRKKFRYDMDQIVRDVFGCSPQDFKKYISSIRVSRLKK